MSTPLDPAITKLLLQLPVLELNNLSPKAVRKILCNLHTGRASAPRVAGLRVDEIEVQGAIGPLTARMYRTVSTLSPTVVLFHGGGWVAGDLDSVDQTAQLLSLETGAVVVSVNYRRPPETRFPGAFDDAVASLMDVADRIGEFGGDITQLGVAGESAGGNLAAAAAISARDAGLELAGQLLIYPVTDVGGMYADSIVNTCFPSRSVYAEGYFLTISAMQWFANHYLSDATQAYDWRVSPLRADNLTDVAPAVVSTAWFDPLRDEGAAYAKALQAANVQTVHHQGQGLIHGYFGLTDTSETARLEAQQIRADFKALLISRKKNE